LAFSVNLRRYVEGLDDSVNELEEMVAKLEQKKKASVG
jgi:hypothetical protein